jgi:hypothetical protein
MNRSHPEGGQLLLCISTVWTALAGLNKIKTAQRKTPKGGQKERTHREDHGTRQVTLKIPSAGDVKKRHRRTVNEKQLESEEARPVVPGERTVKSGG